MAAVIIPDIFGSWLQGRRQAEADNWRDLTQYNQVLHGQLSNAMDMATFDPRARSSWLVADNALLTAMNSAARTEDTMAQAAAAQQYNLPQQQAEAKSLGYQQYMSNTPQTNDINLQRARIALQQMKLWEQLIQNGVNPFQTQTLQPSSISAPGAETYPGSPYEPQQ